MHCFAHCVAVLTNFVLCMNGVLLKTLFKVLCKRRQSMQHGEHLANVGIQAMSG